jgi:hypothetical protein
VQAHEQGLCQPNIAWDLAFPLSEVRSAFAFNVAGFQQVHLTSSKSGPVEERTDRPVLQIGRQIRHWGDFFRTEHGGQMEAVRVNKNETHGVKV